MFRLLLVEDEYIEREAMKHIINQRFPEFFDIKEAGNGLEAIEIARSFEPDVIFLDIKMPGCSGIEVARKIQEFLPESNMIFITAYDYFDYAKEAISLGVDEYLLKPVDIDEVCQYIKKMIQKLQEKQLNIINKEKIEQEFTVIKKKFETEFKELLMDYHASEESIIHYLEIMDIKMNQAVIGLIDFSTIDQYKEMDSIRQEVIKERLMTKIEHRCESNHMLAIIGELKDITTIIFIIEENVYRNEEVHQILDEKIGDCISAIDLAISYQLSSVILNPGEIPKILYKEKQRLFESVQGENRSYPFEVEDEIIECIRKKEFEKAKDYLTQLVDYLTNECEFIVFKKELKGLYILIERGIRRHSVQLLLPNADKLVQEVTSYTNMLKFYNYLFDYAIEGMQQQPDKNQVLVEKICKYLQTHYNEDISLEEAASMIGFSSFYFAKLMKEYKQVSYVDYMTGLRIEKAKQLLEKTDMSVKDVGTEVGYETANYFTRVFKRTEGITPSQYKSKFH